MSRHHFPFSNLSGGDLDGERESAEDSAAVPDLPEPDIDSFSMGTGPTCPFQEQLDRRSQGGRSRLG